MKVSKFQFVQVEKDRIVVRFYNEENDRFEKVCACKAYSVYEDAFLRADSNYYFAYEGKLYPLGEGEVVLSDRIASGILRMFDTSQLKLPFKALFLLSGYGEYFACAQDYEQTENSVRIKLPNGKMRVYEYVYGEPDFDGRRDVFLTSWDK